MGKKRKKRRKAQKTEKSRQSSRLPVIAAAGVLLAALLGYMLLQKGGGNEVDAGGEIFITPAEYDFGEVSVSGGEVSADLRLRNIGNKPLVLSYIDSSCACTTASVIYRGKEGPRFTMSEHGTNPENWRLEIPPGDEAVLRIYYNPKVHPDLRGEVSRYIEVYSSDPEKPVIRVWIRVFQVS